MDNNVDALSLVLHKVADRLVEHEFRCWFYGDSIGFEGLIAASELFGQPGWRDFSRGFFRGWATRAVPYQPDDNTAPGHAMCAVVDDTSDAVLKQAVIALAEYLSTRRQIDGVPITFEDCLRSLREPYGGVVLSEEDRSILENPGAGIYVDCLHFDPPFLAHLSRLTGDDAYARQAVDQALGYGRLLRDPGSGLYHHFWLERTGRPYITGWGRGQGWALLGLLDVAVLSPAETRGVDAVSAAASDLADVMLDYQRDDGHWFNMVHEPRSSEESSTAAFMATAFYRGMTHGLLDRDRFLPAADAAFQAMLGKLEDNGDYRGVTAAVYSSTCDEHYWHVPSNRIVPWGQGPVLTAAAARAAFHGTAGI